MTATKRHFTLVEIIVVLVIIVMIMAFAVPAFNRILTGNAVSYGSRMVSSQLNMARIEACARRRNVAVIFIMDAPAISSSRDVEGIYRRRAFRSCYVTEALGHYTFDKWVPGTKWELLPVGAFFDSGHFTASKEVRDVVDDSDTKLFADNSTISNAIIFLPTGRPDCSSASPGKSTRPRVTVCEGVIPGNAASDGGPAKENSDNWISCWVNRFTGAITSKQHGQED